ncbi:conserved Plasmodium protein, unknown function [Plasmodium gallinaceum]|uniref:Uncharacterized protein n=1 Tax=Plasmodium gallinaceum TaxID=5849 RepID=A0A1J1GRV9_PLAGA|nr:conserved Plasmodium protein, unknown function [Plasmodium gallinaceum]CRG95036.1 conserved Plasmodium protein, unknown function [Plasmodium gallinaceum]
MEENCEVNTKSSFFDDDISIESKKEKEYEIKNNKNEQIKEEMKSIEVNLNNEMESTIIMNYKKRKTTNLDEIYYSLKLPKFIDVNSEIIKKKKSYIECEQEEGEIESLNKNKSSIISWSFDEEMYNKKKIENNKTDKENEDKLFFGDDINIKNDNNEEYIDKINVNEKKIFVNNELEYSCKKEDENKLFNENDEKDPNKSDEVKDKEENLNSFSTKSNKLDKIKKEYSTDEESNFNENMSDLTNLEDLYEKYEIENSDIMSISSNESNENMKDLCNNLKYLETNSFIVEYEDGKFIFFVNQKPYILEEDNEVNYLIESTDQNIKPIHCKLEKKFFVKSFTTEEQIIPSSLKLKKEDIYYSLDDNMKINEEIEKI